MFLLQSLFLTYRFIGGPAPIVGIVILFSLCIIAGLSLKLTTWKDVLPYSVVWTLIAIGLDLLFSYPYAGFAVFSNVSLLIGYGLILFVPLVAPRLKIRG